MGLFSWLVDAPREPTRRYISRHKCKTCGIKTSGRTYGQDARRAKGDPKRRGDVYSTPAGDLVLDCRRCGRALYASQVRGRVVPEIPCGPRCLAATGTSCDCSCGGANHGAGHSG